MISRAGNWERLQDFIDGQFKLTSSRVCLGGSKTFEHYREEVGYMRALSRVVEEMNTIAGTDKSPFVERE